MIAIYILIAHLIMLFSRSAPFFLFFFVRLNAMAATNRNSRAAHKIAHINPIPTALSIFKIIISTWQSASARLKRDPDTRSTDRSEDANHDRKKARLRRNAVDFSTESRNIYQRIYLAYCRHHFIFIFLCADDLPDILIFSTTLHTTAQTYPAKSRPRQ